MNSPFQLDLEGVESPVDVQAFSGREGLSRAWRFDFIVSGSPDGDLERVALGRPAVATFDREGHTRVLHGVVARITLDDAHSGRPRAGFRVRVVPRLAMLRRTKCSRIFQDKNVPEIVASVLGQSGIATRFALGRAHPRRAYCTQYEESDYDFVRRLLAEAGIYFYFFGGPPADASLDGVLQSLPASTEVGSLLVPGDSVVCADASSFYPAVAGDDPSSLAVSTAAALASPEGGMAPRSVGAARQPFPIAFADSLIGGGGSYRRIWSFSVMNRVRPTIATFRDYDPERPNLRLQSAASGTEPFAPSAADLVNAVQAAKSNATAAIAAESNDPTVLEGGISSRGTPLRASAMEVYEHHSPFLFPSWPVARDEAPLLLAQTRRRASVARGEGGCHDFSVGHSFELNGSKLDGGWTLTTVEHEGNSIAEAQDKQYVNRFECVPSTLLYPPKRPGRASVQVALTATVVGPAGEEIFTDERGRIKVQFHWDRDGRFDGFSSCWARPMQPWGGARWGHQFIPRVGMEVLVVFDGGDPDKPLVAGAFFNATHPPSFPLPLHKTRSGIRTQTSPGGDGFNELSFEDARGREEIYLHAERNLREEIGTDRTTRIGADATESIGNNRSVRVGATLSEHVDGDRHEFTKAPATTS